MNLQAFLIGLALGFVSAVIGAVVEYLIVRRSESTEEGERLPGCMLLISGGLGGVGMLAIAFSLLATGEVVRMLITGLGVTLGFVAGFMVMMLAWFVAERPSAHKEKG